MDSQGAKREMKKRRAIGGIIIDDDYVIVGGDFNARMEEKGEIRR